MLKMLSSTAKIRGREEQMQGCTIDNALLITLFKLQAAKVLISFEIYFLTEKFLITDGDVSYERAKS
jgi:hypothetical protein